MTATRAAIVAAGVALESRMTNLRLMGHQAQRLRTLRDSAPIDRKERDLKRPFNRGNFYYQRPATWARSPRRKSRSGSRATQSARQRVLAGKQQGRTTLPIPEIHSPP